ncbi:MAG: glycosyl hydrolase 115 family protein [Lachnospiraceae bacterium]|nr:glycosyl hydrolase 115 family protein [Lachnospiraceae bacterium]
MKVILNRNTRLYGLPEDPAIKAAASVLMRDIGKTCRETELPGADICLTTGKQDRECFCLKAKEGKLVLEAGDRLGFIYGIYEISRSVLGVHDFWFWNDQKFTKQESYEIPEGYRYQSWPWRVRYRGWFVNDEVLIQTWSVERDKEKPWRMVFEALLRCGGNMVIPGTDRNGRMYRKTASDMGLYITHHHAEPLGAEMFARAYPQETASYDLHPELFEKLWGEGIESQKGMNVIWNLGFRGQGDRPFWDDDPKYQTPEARGMLMSRLIRLQYEMVQKKTPGSRCCTNLYGETMELYRDGWLKLPEDIIKIWADNGFGKMVSRRQWNHNPRIYSLPEPGDGGCHGIYYHVSFYDLQAANHITMLPNSPEFVQKELCRVLDCGADDYWIINCSNVKPHVYFLDFIARIWKDGDVDIEKHRKEYVGCYYGEENLEPVSACLQAYPGHALAYGKHEDEHAGEQFSNHVTRDLVSQYMKNTEEATEELLWATDGKTLREQTVWYRQLCCRAKESYTAYVRQCEQAANLMEETGRRLFEDSILLQAKIHQLCYEGGYEACNGILLGLDGAYQRAFYAAGRAREFYLRANQAMRDREHGKWHGFYANDCFTDIKQTAWLLGGMMTFIRNLGDGPHFYLWQKEFMYSEEDKRIMLLLNLENHLKDEELFALMKERWEE